LAGLARRDTMKAMEIAFFDLDKTIVARSSPLAFGRSFFREGLISRSWLIKSVYAQLLFHLMGADDSKMQRMQEEAAKLTEGWEAEKVTQVVEEVLEEVISPLIYAEALELIHDHRAAGRLICIVSSSPQEIVQPLAGLLGVDRYIASRPRIVDGKYTGELDFYAYGPHKAEAMKELADELDADLENCFAYSDSVTDLPMLEAVGNAVVVNPDKELRKLATERGWTTEEFRNPVTLRDKLPDLRARMPEFKLRERMGDLHLRDRFPEFRVPENVADRGFAHTLSALKEREGAGENARWVALGVVGAATAAWWVARKAGARSE
jgi:HAD superfamily hydrolase (TIGR01490 family)